MLAASACFYLIFSLHAHAGLVEAKIAYQKGDLTTALKEIQPLAANGDAQAQGMLAYLYQEGQGVSQNYKQAAHWYRKASEQRDNTAQLNLGVLYEKGQGVTLDYKQAAHW